MSRYIRYKYQKQQINFLNCDDLNKWIDTCQTRIIGFDSVCSSSCNCKEYGEYEPIVSKDTLSFAWSGDTSTQTYKLNGTTYTATSSPYSTTLSELGITELTSCKDAFFNTNITNLISFPDTSNVTDMGTLFGNCYCLTSLDLSNFNTENVTSFRSTFNGCSGLTELDLSNFNTSNVTDVSFAFSRCINLQSLNVSSWDVNHITNDNSVSIFTSTCTSLTSLTVKSGTKDWWYARLVDAGIEDNVTITEV